jgi:hypothetical protein
MIRRKDLLPRYKDKKWMGELLINMKINKCQLVKEKEIDNGVTIIYDSGIDSSTVSTMSRNIIKIIAKDSSNYTIYITSTIRTPIEQATIMYEQSELYGTDAQKKLYGNAGDKIIDVYITEKNNKKSKDEIINAMEKKINEIGGYNISHHIGDPKILNVFDISSNRMANASSFLSEAKKYVGVDIDRVINETDRNCYHFEIKQ